MQNHHSVEEIYGYCADNWPETHTPEHLSVLCHQLIQILYKNIRHVHYTILHR